MEPMTRSELFMAAAAGEYSGELPEPVTRSEFYWQKIAQRIDEGSSVSPEAIDAAIEDYLNTHDADMVTEAELSDALSGKANASHTHAQSDVTGLESALLGKANASHTHAQSDVTGLETALLGKAAASHTHAQSDVTGLETALLGKANASHTHAQSDVTGLETVLLGKAAASHTHDDRYYTETEIDTALSGKSNTGHTHDDRYYTEAEVDTLLSGKADGTDIPDVSSFITKTVNDLTYYYTKSETYTQSEIDNMVSAIPKFAIEVVQSLPSQDISPTTVYLLTVQSGQQGNMYDEYIHVGNSWELLGTQTVDLSGYYTSAQVDALLNGLPVAGHTHDDRYYTEAEIDGKIQAINTAISGKAASDHTHDDRYYTETEIDTALSGKSNTGHSHTMTDVTGLDSALSGKANASHTHAQSEVTGLETALSGKANASHTHAQSDVTGLESVLSGKANASHTHTQSDVTGLETALSGKANASHTHTKSQITDLANAVASTNGSGGSAGLMSANDKEKLNGINIAVLTQAQYEALDPPDSSTLYLIPEEAS